MGTKMPKPTTMRIPCTCAHHRVNNNSSFIAALSQQSYHSSPAVAILSQLSYSSCPMLSMSYAFTGSWLVTLQELEAMHNQVCRS